jgi:hypothetical protein
MKLTGAVRRPVQRVVRWRQGYSPETWVTVVSRDMGHSVMILVGTQGGAPCPGDTPPPWTRTSKSLLTTCDERGRSLNGAPCTASVVRRATSGASALSPPVHQVWRITRAPRAPAPSRRLSTSSRPSSRCAVDTLHGAPRHWCRSCTTAIRIGRCPGAPRSATSCAAMAWSRRSDTIDTSATPANRPH